MRQLRLDETTETWWDHWDLMRLLRLDETAETWWADWGLDKTTETWLNNWELMGRLRLDQACINSFFKTFSFCNSFFKTFGFCKNYGLFYCGPNPAGRIPLSKPANIRFSYITATTTKNWMLEAHYKDKLYFSKQQKTHQAIGWVTSSIMRGTKIEREKHLLKQTLRKKEQSWLDQQENAHYYRKVFQL